MSEDKRTFRERYLPPDATMLRRIHGGMTILWFLLIAPSILWWGNSVKWVVLMSVWANLASHFAAWQAARGEVKQEESTE